MTEVIAEKLFEEDLILVNQHYESLEEFFKQVSSWLYEKNYVTDSFLEAIMEREVQFPTGLHTPYFDVAIPHTDPKHIVKPFIAVIQPDTPIVFKEMGNLDGKTDARLIFVIGFKQSENQLVILQKLMKMLSEEKMTECLNTNEPHEIYKTLTKVLD